MWNKIITTLLMLITLTTAAAQGYTKKPNFKDIEATMERIMKNDRKTNYSYISQQMLNAIVSAGNSINLGNEIGIPHKLIKKIDYIKSVSSDGAPTKYFLEQISQLREKTIKECGFETIAYISTPQKSSSIYMYKGEGGETILTLSHSIYFDSQWVHIGKGLEIVDSLTNDVYKVRGYADGYPMGKLLIIKGCKGKNILIRMRFPKLKRNVETICLYERIHPDDISPSNMRVDDELIAKNIKVADYRVKRSPKKRK